jgi:hypothetical protein
VPNATFIGEIGTASSELGSERRVGIRLAEPWTGRCFHPWIGLSVDGGAAAARLVEQENGKAAPGRGDGRRDSGRACSDDDEIVARVQCSRAKL